MLLIFASLGVGLITVCLIAIFGPISRPIGLVDKPCVRKNHSRPVPLVGGLALYISVVLTLTFLPAPFSLSWLLASSAIIVLIGCLDDLVGLTVGTRLFCQFLTTCVMASVSDIWITDLGIDFISIDIDGWFSVALTVLVVVGLTNAFNLSDGIDGLACGQFITCLACLYLAQLVSESQILYEYWLLAFASASVAFFLVNVKVTPIEKVFLGDAGSLFIGFSASWFLIIYSQPPLSSLEPVAALWCVTIPAWDTLVVVLKRLREGRSIFEAGRDHLHHLFVDRGVKSNRALTVILLLSMALNSMGIAVTYCFHPEAGIALYVILFAIFAYVRLLEEPRQS